MIVNLDRKVLNSSEYTEIKTKMMTNCPPAELVFQRMDQDFPCTQRFPKTLSSIGTCWAAIDVGVREYEVLGVCGLVWYANGTWSCVFQLVRRWEIDTHFHTTSKPHLDYSSPVEISISTLTPTTVWWNVSSFGVFNFGVTRVGIVRIIRPMWSRGSSVSSTWDFDECQNSWVGETAESLWPHGHEPSDSLSLFRMKPQLTPE